MTAALSSPCGPWRNRLALRPAPWPAIKQGKERKEARSAYDAEGRRKYLTRTEGAKFLKCAGHLGKADRLLCETAYYTGCRITEALSLTGEDIDQAQSVIRILCLKKRGKSETRRVPVPAALARELQSLGAKSPAAPLWNRSRTTGWRVIKGSSGKTE